LRFVRFLYFWKKAFQAHAFSNSIREFSHHHRQRNIDSQTRRKSFQQGDSSQFAPQIKLRNFQIVLSGSFPALIGAIVWISLKLPENHLWLEITQKTLHLQQSNSVVANRVKTAAGKIVIGFRQ